MGRTLFGAHVRNRCLRQGKNHRLDVVKLPRSLRVSDFLLADIAAVTTFQFPEDDRGEDGESAQHHQRLVDTVNHLPAGWRGWRE